MYNRHFRQSQSLIKVEGQHFQHVIEMRKIERQYHIANQTNNSNHDLINILEKLIFFLAKDTDMTNTAISAINVPSVAPMEPIWGINSQLHIKFTIAPPVTANVY